ncbi:hypothetical protein ACIG5E_34175 [Kitasatospora sp. NPDC053057]|uniref:hypothetical protein n=1 Tax=Kitasatospora sp. NPDC053057 TaxID=3364062 RepID=UPI0037C5F3EC
MIQHGRTATDVTGVAKLAGMSVQTWRRNRHAEFVKAVEPLACSKKPLLYDVEQAQAFIDGQPIPALPDKPAEHPADLLTDAEVAEVAGIKPSTVRDEAADGRMDRGTEVAGRRFWTRAEAEARRDRPAEARQYRGRTPGSKNKAPRERPTDERAAEVAAELAAAEAGARGPVTAAELAERYGVSIRTAERAIIRAQELSE